MNTPFPVLRAADISLESEGRQWLIEQLWSHNAVGIPGGPAKTCKSWLGLDMAVSVASQTPCLGRFAVTDPGPALLYMAEDSLPAVRERLAAMCNHRMLDLSTLDLFVIDTPALRLDLPEHRRRLHNTIRNIKPRVLFLDPLVRLHRADENNAMEMADILGFLRELQRTFSLALILVHHTAKKYHPNPGQTLRGSSDIHAWTDSGLFLRKNAQSLVLAVEHRHAAAPRPMVLRLVMGARNMATHLEVTGDWDPTRMQRNLPLTDEVTRFLDQADGPVTRDMLRRQLKVNNKNLGNALTVLEHKGLIQRSAQGWTTPGSNTQPCIPHTEIV